MTTPVSLPAGIETTLGTVSATAGQTTSVVLDRTASPDDVADPPLNSLTSDTTVVLKIYATTDGVSWYQILSGVIAAGLVGDSNGNPVTTSGMAVSAAPGEVQHKVTATMASSAGVTNAGVGATVQAG